jgi:hypothetical protein
VLAHYLAARCEPAESYVGEFPGRELSGLRNDNSPNEVGDELTKVADDKGLSSDGICTLKRGKTAVAKSPTLEWLWIKAREEWVYPPDIQ